MRALHGAAAAAAAGLLHTASFAPLEAWWLQPLALAALWALVRRAPTARAAAFTGWAFGAAGLAAGLWWLVISMWRYGGMPLPLAVAALLVLAALLALYPALALGWAWRHRARPLAGALAFALAWLAAELARAQWFTGFPWIASGYAHSSGPLAGWAPWVGVYGIGLLSALAAAALPALRQAPVGAALVLLLVLGGGVLAPRSFSHAAGTLAVSLLQTNVAQDLKFDLDRMEATVADLKRQMAQARGALVVTPESAVPLPNQLVLPERGAALVGLFLGDDQRGWVNSLAGLHAGQPAEAAYRYGKQHLLPFGEFIPPGFGWLVATMHIPIGDQARGHNSAPFVVQGIRLRPLICYEDLFGEDFAASVVGPQGAHVLVNSSNLAWFGRWMVQDQHLQFSRLRALEFQRPVVRATNTGATAVVDHLGRVTHRLPPEVQATLEATVQARSGDTPYARWLAAAGLWPLWALVAAGALALSVPGRRHG